MNLAKAIFNLSSSFLSVCADVVELANCIFSASRQGNNSVCVFAISTQFHYSSYLHCCNNLIHSFVRLLVRSFVWSLHLFLYSNQWSRREETSSADDASITSNSSKMITEKEKKDEDNGSCFFTPPRRRCHKFTQSSANGGKSDEVFTPDPRDKEQEEEPPQINRCWKCPPAAGRPSRNKEADDENVAMLLPPSSSLLGVSSRNNDGGANALAQEELAFRTLTRDLETRFLARQRSAFDKAQAQEGYHPRHHRQEQKDLKNARNCFTLPEQEDEFFLCLPSDIAQDNCSRDGSDRQQILLSSLSTSSHEKDAFPSPLSSLGGSPVPDASYCTRTDCGTTSPRKNNLFSSLLLDHQQEHMTPEDESVATASATDENDVAYGSCDLWRHFASNGHVEKYSFDSNRYFVPIRPRLRENESNLDDFLLDISKLNQDFPGGEETAWLERVAHCDQSIKMFGSSAKEIKTSKEQEQYLVPPHEDEYPEPAGFGSLDHHHDESKKNDSLPPVKTLDYSQGCFIQQRKKARTVSISHDCGISSTPLVTSTPNSNKKSYYNGANDTSMEEEMVYQHAHHGAYHISSPPRKVSYAKSTSTKVFGSTAILAPTPIRLQGYSHAQYHNALITKDHATESSSASSTKFGQEQQATCCSEQMMPTRTPLHYDCNHRTFGFSEYHRMVHSIHCESPFYK
jgi:hypothetical protein